MGSASRQSKNVQGSAEKRAEALTKKNVVSSNKTSITFTPFLRPPLSQGNSVLVSYMSDVVPHF